MTSGDAAVDLKERIETCARMLAQGVDASEAKMLLELGDGPARAAERLSDIWKSGRQASVLVTWTDDLSGGVTVFKVSIQPGGGALEDIPSPGAPKTKE